MISLSFGSIQSKPDPQIEAAKKRIERQEEETQRMVTVLLVEARLAQKVVIEAGRK